MLTVDSTTESDPHQRKLFTSLGVKAWEAPEICRLVLKVHQSANFEPEILEVDQLISHTAFLYKASWQPPKIADLWFATMQNERCLGRKLYIPESMETNSPAARLFTQLQKQFAVIHHDYLKAFPLDADWPMWLVNNLGLSKVPRLITPHMDPILQPTLTLEIPEKTIMAEELVEVSEILENARPDWSGEPPVRPPTREDSPPPPPPGGWTSGPPVRSTRGYTPSMLPSQIRGGPGSPPPPPPGSWTGRPPMPITGESSGRSPVIVPRSGSSSSRSGSRSSSRSLVDGETLEDYRSQKDNLGEERRVETTSDARFKETTPKIDPLATAGNTERGFTLSEEFNFMFHECHSCDILQLLRDNWHHYSQWINGAHMKWQNSDFLESYTKLRNSLGACLVQSAKGSLPLQETVLPIINPQLDKGHLIPTINIKEPQHPG